MAIAALLSPALQRVLGTLLSLPTSRGTLGVSGGSCPSSAPFPTAVALCFGGAEPQPGAPLPCCSLGLSTAPPFLPPGAEKVSQICRNHSGGARLRLRRSFDVTPACPTGAAPLP